LENLNGAEREYAANNSELFEEIGPALKGKIRLSSQLEVE
jgi:hypothetical protein